MAGHKCTVCERVFRDRGRLVKHALTHDAENVCPHCGKRIKRAIDFQSHIRTHEGRDEAGNFGCQLCPMKFKKPFNLRRHVERIHTVRPTLKCTSCKFSTKSKETMSNHVNLKHNDALRRACEECGKKFRHVGALILHRRQHAGRRARVGGEIRFRCAYCRQRFNARLARTMHMAHCGERRRPVQRGGAGDGGRPGGSADWETEFALDGAASIHRMYVTNEDQTHDLNIALIANRQSVIDRLRQQLRKLRSLKFWMTVRVGATRETKDGVEEEEKFLRSKNHILLGASTCESEVERCILQVIEAGDDLRLAGSSWQISNVYVLEINIAKYKPLAASSYIPLPQALSNPKFGIINIQNKNDNECFRWCCLAAKYPYGGPHPERVSHYEDYFNRLGFGKMNSADFKVENIERFEKINPEFSFSVVTGNERKVFTPLYASYEKSEIHVCLLYFADKSKTKYHYALVKDMDTLLRYASTSKRVRKHFCRFCFFAAPSAGARDGHEQVCRQFGVQKSKLPPPGASLSFDSKYYGYTERQEYVLVFDFECYMRPVAHEHGKKTRRISEHVPFLYTIIVIDHLGNRVLGPLVHADREGVAEHFISKVLEIENELFTKQRKDFPRHMSHEQWEQFDRASRCGLCNEVFYSHHQKVADHCHLTPAFNYRDALHRCDSDGGGKQCNALRRRTNRLVAVAHNGNRYDNCIVLKAAVDHPAMRDKEIKVIPKTKSHYLSFRINLGENGRAIVFIDSFRHLMAGLDTLAKGLLPSEKLVLNRTFPVPSRRSLVDTKGVYFYDYVTDYDQLYEAELPPIEKFYSRVRGEGISTEMYEHAQNVYKTFQCPNLLTYAIIYCVCDTALLCDVISSYRRTTWETFGLEAMRFVSGASLSWACALKKTRVKVSLISDASQFNFCELAVRGGQSVITTRFAEANHEECKNYDPTAPKSFISAYDATALYGGALSKRMPISDFEWVGPEEFDPLSSCEEDEHAYFWMVDAEYPEHLHAEQRDFPAMPEKIIITPDMLSPRQHALLEASGRKMPANEVRLVSHLGRREKYVCHSLTLKTYMEMGVVITKVHKGLKFRQEAYLKPYMDYLTEKRAAAKSEFEGLYFKQKGNDVFGYSLKSNRHHIKVVMCRTQEKLLKLVKNPFFHSFEIFGPDLIAVQMRQATVDLSFPVSLGCSVLDKSKIYGYQLYAELKKQLGPSSRLLCHDTDCWMMHYESEDFIKSQKSIAHIMDFSNYPPDHELYDASRKRIPLFLKDEHPARMITSFIGLRAKNYCLQFAEGKDITKCKGVQRGAVKRELSYANYKKCLTENYTKSLSFSYIRQDGKQTLFTWDTVKCALTNFDTKRYFCPDGIHTVPHFYRGPPVGPAERGEEGESAGEEDGVDM